MQKPILQSDPDEDVLCWPDILLPNLAGTSAETAMSTPVSTLPEDGVPTTPAMNEQIV
jgi:hypothetical protein